MAQDVTFVLYILTRSQMKLGKICEHFQAITFGIIILL